MRLLLISHYFPLPAHDGGRIAFLDSVKYLARAHEVGVVCLVGFDEEAPISELENYCSFVRVFRCKAHEDSLRLLAGMVLDPPGSLHKYWYRDAGALITETVRTFRPHVVECHSLHTAIYRRFCEGIPTVLRKHNVEYKVWERYAGNASGWAARNYARWTTPRVRRYEAEAASQFDRCIVVSPADAELLRAVSPMARVEVVPFGVDTEYFYPFPEVPEEPGSMTITGHFGWGPKQQSLRDLLTKVFPALRAQYPEAKLYVVGKGVPDNLNNLAGGMRGVVLTGPVADVRPYIARSSLLINYMVSGGGIALKVLEAMAMRKSVLCNLLGCEGIPLMHGRDVLVADGPEGFASAAAYLLRDGAARRRLADQGHRRVLESYSWNVIAKRLQQCYQSVIDERRHFDAGIQIVRVESPGGAPRQAEN